MKKSTLIPWILIFGLFLIQSKALYAQDSVKVASEVHKKVLVDNDKVTMMEVEFAPGDVTPWHHHPNYLTYVLSEGPARDYSQGQTTGSCQCETRRIHVLPRRDSHDKKYRYHSREIADHRVEICTGTKVECTGETGCKKIVMLDCI